MLDIGSGYEIIRKIAEHEVEKLHLLEYGKVESVNIHSSEDDGVGYTCSVLLLGRFMDGGQMLKIENVPIITQFTGQVDVPYIDDLVLISYINGDFELPVIVGRLYSKEKGPPLFEAGQHLIELAPHRYHPDGPKESRIDIKFTDGSQATINITSSKLAIKISETEMTLRSGSEPSIELRAKNTTLTMKEDGDITIRSKAKIEFKADSDINLTASGNVNIKGSNINLN